MKYFILFILLFIVGCSSSRTISTLAQYEKTINELNLKTDLLGLLISSYINKLPTGSDVISKTKLSAVNKLLDSITFLSVKDVEFNFLQTKPLWTETNSILGLTYTNFVDIDTGKITIDLKKFRIISKSNNILTAEIELEGSGEIKVSGKYTGIISSASPKLHFYLKDELPLNIMPGDSDYIVLTPMPKDIILKAKVSIDLYKWNIPFYKEIKLISTDLIKPILVPSAINSEILFPIPSPLYGKKQIEFIKYQLYFSKISVSLINNTIEYRSDISFNKK